MIKSIRFIYVIILVSLFFSKPDVYTFLDPSYLNFYSTLFIISVLVHLYFYSNYFINWFRIDIFFILGFGIVHFQWPFMFGFSGISPQLISNVWIDEKYVLYGTWMSAVGMNFWFLGYGYFKNVDYRSISVPGNFFYFFNYRKLLIFTMTLFFLFLATAGNDFLSGGVYKGSGGSASGEGISAYIGLVFSVAIIVLSTFVILDKKNRYTGNLVSWFLKLDFLYLILIFTYITLFLFIGDRGGPVSLVLAIFVLIGNFVRPIRLRELVFFVFLGSIVLTLVSLGRSQSYGFDIFSAGYSKLNVSSGYDATLELANSVRSLFQAISEVPSNYDYFYGKLWVSDLLAPIPFAQSIFIIFTNTPPYELGSSTFITYLTHGVNPTSGEGSTLIADIYLNFSIVGVCVFMFLLGVFFKKINNHLFLESNIKWILIGVFVASFSLYFSRSGLFITVRPIIWGIILYHIFVKKSISYK